MKVNEIFTVEREVSPSIGTNYFLVRLEGGLALLEEGTRSEPGEYRIGAPLKNTLYLNVSSRGKRPFNLHFSGPLLPMICFMKKCFRFKSKKMPISILRFPEAGVPGVL